MLESVSLQKNRIRSAKNVIFSLLCILVDRPMGGGFEPPKPPLRTPLFVCHYQRTVSALLSDAKWTLLTSVIETQRFGTNLNRCLMSCQNWKIVQKPSSCGRVGKSPLRKSSWSQGCRSLLSIGGDNLQFYPNFALFSTLGGMNLNEIKWRPKKKGLHQKGTLFSPNSGEAKKNVFTKNETLFPQIQVDTYAQMHTRAGA